MLALRKMIVIKRYEWPIAVMMASAFVGGGWAPFSIGGIELYPLRLASLILLPIMLMPVLNTPASSKPTRMTMWVIMCTLGWGTLSLLWSPDRILGLRSLVIIFTGMSLTAWMILYARSNEDRLLSFLRFWCVFSILTSIVGYYEIATGSYILAFSSDAKLNAVDRSVLLVGWFPPKAFSSNWNNFAFDNALSLLVMLGTAMSPATRKLRPLAMLSAVLLVGLIVSSVSRAAVGGAVVGAGVLGWMLLTEKSGLRKMLRKRMVLLAVSVIVIGCVYLWARYGALVEYAAELLIAKNAHFGGLGLRELYYSKAIDSVFGDFGLGAGLGASKVIINGASYHNFFIEILAELGVPVFLLFMALHIRIGWLCYKKRKEPDWRPFRLAMVATVIVLPILIMGPSSAMVEPIYWLWLGFAATVAAGGFSKPPPVVVEREATLTDQDFAHARAAGVPDSGTATNGI